MDIIFFFFDLWQKKTGLLTTVWQLPADRGDFLFF